MPFRRLISLSLLLAILAAILAAGLLWLRQPGQPGLETAVRRQALLQANRSGPAPATTAGAAEGVAGRFMSAPPIVVDLADLPTAVPGASQYERWRRGEIDLDEQHELISPAERAALEAAAQRLAPAALPDLLVVPETPLTVTGFDSLHFNDHPTDTYVPPDPELAAGPNHIIAVVNTIFEVYNKSGATLVGPLSFETLFAPLPNCSGFPFDPNVLYDESADRFLLGVDGGGSYYCLAVSVTNNPTGSWYLYEFFTGTGGAFFDYPHAGVGRDAIYLGANQFMGSSFLEGRVWAFNKSNLYAGAPAASVTHSLTWLYDTPQPANLHGFLQGTWPSSGPHYIMTEVGDGHNYTLFSWSDPFGANVLTNLATFNLTTATGVPAGFPVNAPQQGSSARLQANDFRPLDFEYRNGRLWTTMTVSCNPGTGTVNCLRWAEIDPAGPALVQAGVLSTNGDHRLFPDLAVDRHGNMAVGYTKTSSSIYPAVWAACRSAAAGAGLIGSEFQLKAGERAYTAYDSSPHRWGDYTGMTIDPNGETFWYLGQYSKSLPFAFAYWGTYITGFTYNDCPGAVVLNQKMYLPMVSEN